jgi:hypothetical protein
MMLPRISVFQGRLKSNKSFCHATPLPLLRLSSLVLNDQDKKGWAWLELAAVQLNVLTLMGAYFHEFHAFLATFLLLCFIEVAAIYSYTCVVYWHSVHQVCAPMQPCPFILL